MPRTFPRLSILGSALALAVCCVAGSAQTPKTAVPPPQNPAVPPPAHTVSADLPPADKTTVLEQIIARVNNKIITSSDLEDAKQEMIQTDTQAAQQNHIPQSQVDAQEEEESRDLLRNLIDEQLLLQKADDLGLSAETDTVLQLDKIRQQEKLATMEDLQKLVESQGDNYQEFEQNIKNQILENKVIETDVAPRVDVGPGEIEKYYTDHKAQFVTKEDVDLSEILIATSGKSPEEVKKLKDLADQIQQRAAHGENFAQLANRYSNADSATDGGEIHAIEKSQLSPDMAKILFSLPVNGVSPVMDGPLGNGYLILKVNSIHHAGQETLEDAHDQVENALYLDKIRPELRTYLTRLRQEAYIVIKPGYNDTGASANAGVDLEKFQRILPSDLPKPTEDSGKKNGLINGGGGGLN